MKKEFRVIIGGLCVILLFAGVVFFGLHSFMGRQTEKDVRKIAQVFLEETAEQKANRFEVIKGMRFDHVDYMKSELQIHDAGSDAVMAQSILAHAALFQDLTNCTLISASGAMDTVYGEPITGLEDSAFLMASLEAGREHIVTDGHTAAEQLIIFASPLAVPMTNGETSVGLLWCEPATLFAAIMDLDNPDLLEHFHIIRADTSYVTEADAVCGTSFTENMLSHAVTEKGTVENYVDELLQTMASGGVFTTHTRYVDEARDMDIRRSVHAMPMEDTDWYLLTIMPYGVLDETIVDMGRARIVGLFIALVILFTVLLTVFAVYLRIMQQQITSLAEAKEAAETARNAAQQAQEKADAMARRNEVAVQILHQTLKSGMWGMRFNEKGEMTRVRWSDELRHMIGYQNKEDFPDTVEAWSDLLHPDDKDRVLKAFHDTIEDYTNQKTYDVEYRLLTRDQGYRWFHAAGRLARREDGTPKEYFGFFIDITDRVNGENQLREALASAEASSEEAHQAQEAAEHATEEAVAANKAKSEFLSNMSHDIRTPMNAIVGMTAIAVDHIDDKERVQDCLKKITLSGKQLLGLINDVLDMSKIESGKMTLNPEPLSLKETMETMRDIVRPQIKENGQHFDIVISNILSDEVYCDSVRLNQVLLNFLSNAMKFTPKGGNVFIDLRQEESPKGEAYVRTHFSVKDTGIGMSEEFRKKLFTAFEREDSLRVHKTQGTGLGLTITKYIVDAMGGEIEVQSEVGAGTTFHVTVDLERAPDSTEEMRLPAWRILVVDDNEDLCQTVAMSLSELGARPEICLSGEEAVTRVAEAQHSGNPYFAILLDYKMTGISGVETAKQIREKSGTQVPISLISAYDWSDIEDEARTAGITDYIAKPLFKSTLYHELHKYAEDGGETKRPSAAKKEIDLKGLHILLAEDNDINAQIATMVLTEFGCEVDWAEDGKIAAERFAASGTGQYDAVLMDLRMPNMNGLEATQAIRAMDRPDAATVPIIAMTADAFAEDAQRCLNAGMNAHITKPIDIEELKRNLAKFTGREKAK